MGISYDPTKPAANDKPTNDQAPMQTNFASIKTLIDIDHVDFSSSTYGQHKQITFPSINVPTLPTSAPILFTNDHDGAANALPIAELFLYSGSATQSSNQYNITGSNGSVLLMMGVILKWGNQSFVGSQNPTVTFTHPFPNNCFGVQLTLLNSNGTVPSAWRLSSVSSAAFTANVQASGSTTMYWFAIGN